MFKHLPVALAFIACVAFLGFGVAAFVRARNSSASNACLNNLRQLEGMKAQWALENSKTSNDVPTWETITPYLAPRELEHKPIGPACPQGGTYSLGRAADPPTCSIGGLNHTLR
jgi:hypothetical protein